MGMFDHVRSSYPLPEAFSGVLQTKDIEDGYGGTLSDYWIDPDGYIWVGDYRETHEFHSIPEHDMLYDSDRPWVNFEWRPTGERGKWRVQPITKYVEVYPERFDRPWEEWPRLRLHFRSGRLVEYTDITGQ